MEISLMQGIFDWSSNSVLLFRDVIRYLYKQEQLLWRFCRFNFRRHSYSIDIPGL